LETRVRLPDNAPPSSISEVVTALRSQSLKPKHDKKSWGDWINFETKQTVISIESIRGLTSSATIEEAPGEEKLRQSILNAFSKLGWLGEDEDGPYSL